eukprot:c41655_g1_i1 orf=1-210(-)
MFSSDRSDQSNLSLLHCTHVAVFYLPSGGLSWLAHQYRVLLLSGLQLAGMKQFKPAHSVPIQFLIRCPVT